MVHAHAAVQQFLLELMAEVVEKYNVPGLQFDRARYPQADRGYDDYTVALYRREHDGNAPPSNPSDAAWTAWRTLVSNSPTVYPNSLTNFAQDWPAWMREGSLDFVVPGIDITNTTPEVLIAQIEHTRAQNLKGVIVWYYAGLVRKDALNRLKETVFAEPAALPWR